MSDRRLALRIARREAMRAKTRSILVLVMITLPVLGVTAADVLYRTQSVSTIEGLDRSLGTHAAALVSGYDPATPVTQQAADPSRAPGFVIGDGTLPRAVTAADLTRVLGARPILPIVTGQAVVDTAHGKSPAEASEVDLRGPLAAGLFRLTAGRVPAAPGEAAVNADLAGRGPGLGDDVVVTHLDGTTTSLRVVGLVESATYRSTPVVVALPGSLGVDTGGRTQWLVGGAAVSWHDVRALNALGATVLSRAVVEHPPSDALRDAGTDRGSTLTVLGLVVAMILIEVVLLAGPAFAVGARRQQRALALMAATGGTPRQTRRVVLASAIVLGGTAAVLGVAGGIGLARVLQPLVQPISDTWFGPFQVAWRDVAVVAAFGLVSALLAAVVPAWTASRQDVVAVLAGRRGDRAPSRRSPLLGVLLLGAGIALAVAGAHGHGELSIAFSAIVCVLGMILLVPLCVAVLARLARRLPLALRFAVRDADRHRTRTVPAIAAVAATVAGVVALGIALGSNEKESRATYQPELALGDASVTSYRPYPGAPDPDWGTIASKLRDAGLHPEVLAGDPPQDNTDVMVQAPGAPADADQIAPLDYSGSLSTDLLVSDGALPGPLRQVAGIDRAAAARTLAAGGVVVFSELPHPGDQVQLRVQRWDDQANSVAGATVTVPAIFVHVGHQSVPVRGFVAPSVLRSLGLAPSPVGLYLRSPHLSAAAQRDVSEAAAALGGRLYVERGYQARPSVRIVRLVLSVLGAVLMIGGTLTATFLALSDARPDLATLSAVGAAPRTRRAIAASYALAIGVPGALLGAAVGFVPGLAIAVPLTKNGSTGPFFDVPWLLIVGLVVGLPLLVACLVWVAARSRLPMVARLS